MPEKKSRGFYFPISNNFILVFKDGNYFELNKGKKKIYMPDSEKQDREYKNLVRWWNSKVKKYKNAKIFGPLPIDKELDTLIYRINHKKLFDKNKRGRKDKVSSFDDKPRGNRPRPNKKQRRRNLDQESTPYQIEKYGEKTQS